MGGYFAAEFIDGKLKRRWPASIDGYRVGMADRQAKRKNITTDVVHARFYDGNYGSGADDCVKRISSRSEHAQPCFSC